VSCAYISTKGRNLRELLLHTGFMGGLFWIQASCFIPS
jgi:hypothetical protein